MLRDRLLTRDRNDRIMLASAMAASLVVASVVISMSAAIANPYTLKCTTAAGEPAADLTVDLDRKVMTWGQSPNYRITKVTDRYITAIRNDDDVTPIDVGSEIWVLDRVTGDYKRASVEMFCKESSCRTGSVLQAATYFGRCVRPML